MYRLRSFLVFALCFTFLVGAGCGSKNEDTTREKIDQTEQTTTEVDSTDWVKSLRNRHSIWTVLDDIPESQRSSAVLITYIRETDTFAPDSSTFWGSPGVNQQVADTLAKYFPGEAGSMPKQFITTTVEKFLLEGVKEGYLGPKIAVRKLLSRGHDFAEENWPFIIREFHFAHISAEFLTRDRLAMAIEQGVLLESVNPFNPKQGCGQASYCEVWDSLWTQDLAKRAFASNPKAYGVLPEQFRAYWMAKKLLEIDGTYLRYVPREHKFLNNGELCRIAVTQTDKAAKFIPARYEYDFDSE